MRTSDVRFCSTEAWYLGKPDFQQRLLGLLDKKTRKKSRANGGHESHGEAEAFAQLSLPNDRNDLDTLRKGDHGKVVVAAWLREEDIGGERLDRRAIAHGAPWIGESSGGHREPRRKARAGVEGIDENVKMRHLPPI